MTFADIIGRLQGGEAFTRRAWDGSKFIVCQTPQTIPADVVPNMTSLPERAKELLAASFRGSISYHDQVLVITKSSGEATYYVPTWEEIFANDWYTC